MDCCEHRNKKVKESNGSVHHLLEDMEATIVKQNKMALDRLEKLEEVVLKWRNWKQLLHQLLPRLKYLKK